MSLSISDARLYAILDMGYVDEQNATTVTRALLAGGAGALQIRAKRWGRERIGSMAERIFPNRNSQRIRQWNSIRRAPAVRLYLRDRAL